jgi:hypothetical protein
MRHLMKALLEIKIMKDHDTFCAKLCSTIVPALLPKSIYTFFFEDLQKENNHLGRNAQKLWVFFTKEFHHLLVMLTGATLSY